MPWHERVLHLLWRDLRIGAREGRGLSFRPLLLDGPPGVGKTHLALRLAELARVPHAYVDVATASEGFLLSGAQRTWSSAAPGRPVSTILDTRVGNPLVFVDEVEKGGVHHSTKGVPTSAHLSLLSLLEPASARVWECPYFSTTLDMSHVNWMLAANDARRLPAPLASRLRIVPVRAPTRPELLAFAAREVRRRGLDEDALEGIERVLALYPDGDGRLNLRTVLRLVEDLARLAQTTEVVH
jgi:ATP-dependent Lon protease